MKRLISGILLAALLVSLLPMTALAGTGYAMVTNTNRLNIRSGPGMENAIIGSIPRGEWVEVFGNDGSWVYGRTVKTSITGYFSAGFLKIAGMGSGGVGSVVVVNNPNPSSFLNLRQSPSYAAPVLAIFYNGATGTVLGQTNGWYHVEISGMQGYFRQEFLKLSGGMGSVGTATVYSKNGGSVNLRSGPLLGNNVIGAGSVGTVVTVYLKGSEYWYISMAGTYGFMMSSFLTGGSGGGSGSNPYPNPPIVIPGTTNAIVTNVGKNLNLREQPNTGSRVLGSYPGKTAIQILSQGSVWSRVRVPLSGKTGYMMTRYLTLYGLPVTPTLRVRHHDGTYVNLRTQPSYKGGITVRVPHNSTVTVLIAGGTWAQVKYKNLTGYMMTSFLK
ncbi:MAG: SH3 domain-containing protein [Clostridiales bacterium]|nr:SH3 domain-containing protein [Clostridiales bacterium]